MKTTDPKMVLVNGRPYWDFGHRLLPVISGGSDDGGSGSAGDGAGATGDSNNNNESGNDNKTFTQADLDAKVDERLRRERQKYNDYDSLKAKAEEFDKLQESQKDATQKAVDEAKKQAREEALAEVTQDRFGDRVLVHAAKDFADPEDAVLRLKSRFAEFTNKDGTFDDDGIKSELKSLLKANPRFAATQEKQEGKGSVDGGARKSADSSDVSPGMGRLRAAYAESSNS